jgi:hypothetical protein
MNDETEARALIATIRANKDEYLHGAAHKLADIAERLLLAPHAQPTPPDTKRLDHLEAWLDDFEFVHLPTQIEPEVRCDWFAGDGSGHWFTQGKTFREAIDKSLNHEATQESHD